MALHAKKLEFFRLEANTATFRRNGNGYRQRRKCRQIEECAARREILNLF